MLRRARAAVYSRGGLLTSVLSGVPVKVIATVVAAMGLFSVDAEVSAISQSSVVMEKAFAVLASLPAAAAWRYALPHVDVDIGATGADGTGGGHHFTAEVNRAAAGGGGQC